jgi:hypothetical protein
MSRNPEEKKDPEEKQSKREWMLCSLVSTKATALKCTCVFIPILRLKNLDEKVQVEHSFKGLL